MKKAWPLIIGLVLLVSLLVLYAVEIAVFHETRETFFLMLQDLAFLPVNVLIVTFVLDRLIARREKNEMLQKLNMVIGVFFDEVGSGLIRQFSGFDAGFENFRSNLIMDRHWDEKTYARARKELSALTVQADSRRGNLVALRDYLTQNREFLLRLLANPNLLENEAFTQLLWAVFHVEDELSYRTDLSRLPEADYHHLSGDIRRAYTLLVSEWLAYMNHLRKSFLTSIPWP